MNKEAMNRLKKAREYKKQAIYALFPEKTVKHFEVIEKELQAMAMEFVVEAIKNEESDKKEPGEKEKTSKVKKVNIG